MKPTNQNIIQTTLVVKSSCETELVKEEVKKVDEQKVYETVVVSKPKSKDVERALARLIEAKTRQELILQAFRILSLIR